MSYYNPYSEYQQDYYNPNENTQQQSTQAGQSIGSVVGTMVRDMAIYMVSTAATAAISAAVGARVKSAIINKAPNSYAAKKWAPAGDAKRGMWAKSDTKISTLFKRLLPNETIKRGNNFVRPFRKARRERAIEQRRLYQRDPLKAKAQAISSIFKDRDTAVGVIGNFVRRQVLPGSVVAYGLDNLLGYNEVRGLESKAWYDVPGHVVNYARWLPTEIASVGIMRSIAPLAKSIQGGIGKTLRNSGSLEFVNKLIDNNTRLFRQSTDIHQHLFKDELVRNVSNSVDSGLLEKSIFKMKGAQGTFVQGLMENVRTYATEGFKRDVVRSTNTPHGTKTSNGFLTRVKESLSEINQRRRELSKLGKMRDSHEQPGINLISGFDQLSRASFNTAGRTADPQGNSGHALIGALAQHNRNVKPNNFFAQVLGFRPTTVRDVINTDVISQVSQNTRRYFAQAPKHREFMNKLENAFIGPNMYTNRSGQALDLTYLNPLNTLKRVGKGLLNINLALAVGLPPMGRHLTLSAVTGAHTLLSGKVHAATFTKSTTGLGLIVDNKYSKAQTLGQLAGTSTDDPVISLIGRKFYSFDGFTVNQLDTGNTYLKTSHPSLHGAMGEAKANTYKKFIYDNKHEMDAAVFQSKQMAGNRPDPSVTNPFLYIAKKMDWEAPMWAVHTIGKMRRILQPRKILSNGKTVDYHQQLYAASARGVLGKDIDYDKLHFHVSALRGLMNHTDQETAAAVLNRPTAWRELAELSKRYSPNRNLESDIGIVYSDVELMKVLRNSSTEAIESPGGRVFASMMKDPTVKAAYSYMLEQPSSARNHLVSGRLGRLSDMKVPDTLRVSYVMNKLEWDPASGPHPIISIADEMMKRGTITPRQGEALKLSGSLRTMFSDDKLRRNFVYGHEQDVREAIKRQVSSAKEYHSTMEMDIINYVSNTDMRMPSLTPDLYSTQLAKKLVFESQDLISKVYNQNDNSPYVAFGYSKGSQAVGSTTNILSFGSERFVNLIKDISGFKKDYTKFAPGLAGSLKFIGTRALQFGAATTAFKATDAFISGNPLFDQTMFNDGVTGAAADVGAKIHLMSAKIRDVSGITGMAKYLEGLMPGFTSSAPGALIGAAITGRRGMVSRLGGAVHGVIVNRMLSPFMPDMTKDYQQLSEEYSGEVNVPIIDGHSWLLGTTPWQGRRVSGWQPNWYVQAKSRWKAGDSLYGSELRKLIHEPIFPIGISLGDIIDPYYMERKHYFSRPYPQTSPLGDEMPLGIGMVASNTLGRIIKRRKIMHKDFLEGTDVQGEGPSDPSMAPPGVKDEYLRMRMGTFGARKFSRRSSFEGGVVYSGTANSAQVMADRYLSDFNSALGLVGFGMDSARTALAGKNMVLPTLESSGRMSSQSRSYYDTNLGGLGIFTEPIRRFVQKPDWQRYGVNPIPNMLPNWLPQRFLSGDPYVKIMKGELRLPGRAYETTHPNIRLTMPARASMLGGNKKEMMQYFTGTLDPMMQETYDILDSGTEFHEKIQDWLSAENLLIQAEAFVIDIKNNVSGHVDAIIKDGIGGKGRRALEIKTINEKGFTKLTGPKHKHVSQLNFYLSELGLNDGAIMYISRDNPANVKTFNISFDKYKLHQDMARLQEARSVTGDMLVRGKSGAGAGYAYSWADRMLILSDIAPYSEEYKEAKSVTAQQIKEGVADDEIVNKFQQAEVQRDAVIRRYELYPLRFKGQVMSPDAEVNIQSLNNNIKAADQYSTPERMVGAIWETFTNQNTFLINKFMAFKDPLQHYKQYQLYGKEYTPWTDPMGSFISPMVRAAVAAEGPLEGAVTAGLGFPYLLGGRSGGMYGAVAGGAFGLVHGLVRRTTNSAYIPGRVQQQREINDYYDTLKYSRNIRMASLSEGLTREKYVNQSHETMFNLIREGGSYTDFFRGVYHTEKPYIESWLKENNPTKRDEILRFAPERLGQALKSYWHLEDDQFSLLASNVNISADMASGRKTMPYTTQQLDPSVMLDDIKLKSVQQEGLNSHDFGLGWQEQMLRVQNDMDRIGVSNLGATPQDPEILDPTIVKSALYSILNQMGLNGRINIYINSHIDEQNSVNITVQRDNINTIRNSLSMRDRWVNNG